MSHLIKIYTVQIHLFSSQVLKVLKTSALVVLVFTSKLKDF